MNPVKRVVILNGSGGSGKGTFVGCLMNNSVSVMERSIIDEAKGILYSYGWDGKKDDKSRLCLCTMLDALKMIDAPYRYLTDCYVDFMDDDDYDMLTIDIREPEDIKRMVEFFKSVNCPVKTVLIERPAVEKITTNHADAGVSNYPYDLIIENSGDFVQLLKASRWFIDHYDELNGQKIVTTDY